MSDLGRNIRRIAQTEALQRQINDLLSQVATLKDKQDKLGDRSTSFQSTSSGAVSNAKGDKGSDQAGTDDKKSADKDKDKAGQTSEDVRSDDAGNAGGTGEDGTPNDLSGFSYDLADLESNSPNLGSQIKQLTGLEEVGGSKEASITLDGQFIPPEYSGSGFSNYNADTDPREENFVQGVWYSTSGGYESSNPWLSAQAYATAVLDVVDSGNAPHTVVSVESYDPNTDSTVLVNMTRVAGAFQQNVNVWQSGCVVGTDSWCPSTRPVNNWDVDNIHQLAFDGAQFVSSTAEAAADLLNSWSDSPSTVSGETSNNTGVTITPTDEGGTTVTYSDGSQFTMNNFGIVTSKNY